MKRRIIVGMGANSFGTAVTIFVQLVSLPLFLYYWDTSTYGVWIMLSALPSSLGMADMGMVIAAGNKMTMAIGRGDVPEANRIFQSAQWFMMVVCGSLALLLLPLIFLAPLPWLQTMDQRVALSAMSIGVLVALFGGLTEAVFKSTGRYAAATMLSNLVRLGEWMGLVLGLVVVGSFAAVALAGLAARVVGALVGILLSRRGNHGIHWGTHAAEGVEIRAMIKPAASFMVFPLASALSFQGITLLVGAILGPVAVVLFNTYRTIARTTVQITAIFSYALWPEFSRLYGQGATTAVGRLFRRTYLLGAIQALCLSLMLYFISPWLLRLWTHGNIEFIPSLMLIMLLYAAVGGIMHIPRVLLMATNQHTGLAYWSVAAGLLSVGLAWIMSGIFQLNGIAAAVLTSELFIAIVCDRLANATLSDRYNRKAM